MSSNLLPETVSTICEALSSTDTTTQYPEAWKQLDAQRKQGGHFCDVTFTVKTKTFHAHQCVLATVSKYFSGLFQSELSKSLDIDLSDFSEDVVAVLLDAIYCGVDVKTVDLVELLRLAEYVSYEWLVDALIEAIR